MANQNDLLGELAADAALERTDFLVQATEQLRSFLEKHGHRISELGGLTLIDDDPDFLSIAPDLTFRSRSRYIDDATGEWTTETEILESAAEVVELYNPSDVFAAFAEAAREAAGLPPQPTATADLFEVGGIAPDETVPLGGEDVYAAVADSWAAAQEEPGDEETAAARLFDLALAFQDRSQSSEARLIDEFEAASSRLARALGDFIIADDEDARLTLAASGGFRAEVVPEEAAGEWRALETPEEMVEYYDPTDIFGDLADALAVAFPSIAADGGAGADGARDDARDASREAEDVDPA